MGKLLNSGSTTFSGDLTSASSKTAPKGLELIEWTNTEGYDVNVKPMVLVEDLDSGAANFTLTYRLRVTGEGSWFAEDIISAEAKITTTTAATKALLAGPRNILVQNGQVLQIWLYSDNGSDSSATGYIYLEDVQSNVNVRAVNDETPMSEEDIADQVWDEAAADHVTSDTIGEFISLITKKPYVATAEIRRLKSTNVSLYFRIIGEDGAFKTGLTYQSSGLKMYYVREGGSETEVTPATQTVTGAHSDGGFVEVDATNVPGLYRTDWPDAAFDAPGKTVMFSVSATGVIASQKTILLATTDNDIYGNDGAF